ncbi:MAG: DNA cytosine methyltransferase [Planctomycetes bacterium]|nr:DNA cytosine methyltransferase [Planctomycetota bacterium]
MIHLDLYSGAGCFAIAAEYVWDAEYQLHGFVECEPFAQKWLKANWPGCRVHDNTETYKHDGTDIDLLTGGPPCQPVSVAGRQAGQADDRWQWPTMFRIIQEVEPRFIIFENVFNLINFDRGLLFDGILDGMESAGYETATFVLPACSQDAPHLRKRVFVVAVSKQSGTRNKHGQAGIKRREPTKTGAEELRQGNGQTGTDRINSRGSYGAKLGNLADSLNARPQDRWAEGEKKNPKRGCEDYGPKAKKLRELWSDYEWITGHDGKARRVKPGVCLLVNGYSNRNDLLRLFGNAIVWPVVVPIMEAIKEAGDK